MKIVWNKAKTPPLYVFSSPWLLAAAAGVLGLIIATFALHNYRLEQRLMTESLSQQAATLLRALHSGARASMMDEWRRGRQQPLVWEEHLQRVIEHLAEDPEVVFFAVVADNSTIVAHSDPAQIGGRLQHLEVWTLNEEIAALHHRIHRDAKGNRIFEAYRVFPLAMGWRGPRHHRRGNVERFGQLGLPSDNMPGPAHQGSNISQQYQAVVGLDMKEYDRALARLQVQILLLSLAMLLVGAAGWFSLATVQGYRVSQRTIEEMEAYTALLIAQLPVGVIATNVVGAIRTWNMATTLLTGIPINDALGKIPEDLLPPSLAYFFTNNEHAQQPDAGREHNLSVTLQDTKRTLLCHPLTIIDSNQTYLGRMLLLSDVTELSLLEQRMRETERMAAIGRMAGGVAHEVRNPLSSIKGLALILKNRFPSGSKEQDSAELLIQETERMNRTITEMLSFTRPSQLRLVSVDLVLLVRQTLELLRGEIQERHIEALVDCASDVGPLIVDADRIRQVVLNVLLNAAQSMEQGGRLRIRLRNLDKKAGVELRISDTGRGIEAQHLPQIFYPYFTTRQGGTGIGLAISQKIIAEHGGAIEIESQPGVGTTVIIRLPFGGQELLAADKDGI